MEDVGSTVGLQFIIKILVVGCKMVDKEEPENQPLSTENHFLPVIAKGMLMLDQVTGEGSHSMWVIRLSQQKSDPSPSALSRDAKGLGHGHSETCAETYRLEMQVSECNERLSDLKDTIKELWVKLDQTGSVEEICYAGIPLQNSTPPPSSDLSPLNPSRASVASLTHNTSLNSLIASGNAGE
ncbi:hypothetical protein PPACK8108_LOCUS24525 [Phakopsora pachyrhizi]|uniref:Uncharacterized protein n=1 Tax=Phakopsora pachyrhizi TaxID=170000 RepID=A0AAV0BV16_PHAPC|nr:hypothetical protein PPACK8108_LOCUS24525 [Phakopsora pachyrhizi]